MNSPLKYFADLRDPRVKRTREHLLEEILLRAITAIPKLLEALELSGTVLAADAVSEEIDYGHGRGEQRRCSVIADLSLVEKDVEWASLWGLVRIEAERHHKATGKTECEIRY